MSRHIDGKPDHSEEEKIRDTTSGKLILTDCRGRSLALLIRDNRLLYASVLYGQESRVGAVYLGKVKRVLQNISACFVEISHGELVYLPFSECLRPFLINRPYDGRILEGDELPVQIERDAQKTKQAAATANLTLSGRYGVYCTGVSRIGISTKLSLKEKEALTNFLQENQIADENMHYIVPSDPELPPYGLVVRTEAATASPQDFLEELRSLREEFLSLFMRSLHLTCFSCIKPAKAPWECCVEQIPTWEYCEVVTDHPDLFRDMQPYFQVRNIPLRLYEDTYPLHKLYGIDTKLSDALSRRIWLKSGGYLVVDVTEALTVFDVNSGKYEAKRASENAFYQINLEAAEEIARQIRLRNLSGIILVDFINMSSNASKESLINYMKGLVKNDRVHTKVVDITPLGLMEITRKKVNKPLSEQLA